MYTNYVFLYTADYTQKRGTQQEQTKNIVDLHSKWDFTYLYKWVLGNLDNIF